MIASVDTGSSGIYGIIPSSLENKQLVNIKYQLINFVKDNEYIISEMKMLADEKRGPLYNATTYSFSSCLDKTKYILVQNILLQKEKICCSKENVSLYLMHFPAFIVAC